MKKRTRNVTRLLAEAGVIGALYVALNYAQELILPSTTIGVVQFRLAELLCVLALFTPSAIWGLTVGCALSNLVSLGVMPMDIFLGSFATFLATVCLYALRNVKLFSVPVLSLMMPVVFNAVIIGLELELFYVEGAFEFVGFLTQAGFVALGEFGVCVVLGIPFYLLLRKSPIVKKIFVEQRI